jgi:hypothetical protein
MATSSGPADSMPPSACGSAFCRYGTNPGNVDLSITLQNITMLQVTSRAEAADSFRRRSSSEAQNLSGEHDDRAAAAAAGGKKENRALRGFGPK